MCARMLMHISLWCLPEMTPDLVSAISANMPLWQTCAEIQVKCLFELPFSVYQRIKNIPGFIQLWRYLLFCKNCYQTLPYEHDIKTFCSMVTDENEHWRTRWQALKVLKHFLTVYLSLIIMVLVSYNNASSEMGNQSTRCYPRHWPRQRSLPQTAYYESTRLTETLSTEGQVGKSRKQPYPWNSQKSLNTS